MKTKNLHLSIIPYSFSFHSLSLLDFNHDIVSAGQSAFFCAGGLSGGGLGRPPCPPKLVLFVSQRPSRWVQSIRGSSLKGLRQNNLPLVPTSQCSLSSFRPSWDQPSANEILLGFLMSKVTTVRTLRLQGHTKDVSLLLRSLYFEATAVTFQM